ncbi:MAG: ABC transporter ATP-binding protein, partial [Ruminococcus sp.]|nr:ABC transporter ATP-binding protein [Ruminococcus sp.]
MPPRKNMPVQKPEQVFGTFKRIFSYMYGFKLQLVFVVIGIILSSAAGIAGNYMLKPLIDNIEKSLKTGKWDKAEFIGIIAVIAGIYLLGCFSAFFYKRIMIKVSTESLM